MEFIKKGNNWNEWSIEYECNNNGLTGCGSILKIGINDISYESGVYSSGAYWDDEFYEHYLFECPICKSRKYIDEDLIPYQVQNIIKYKK